MSTHETATQAAVKKAIARIVQKNFSSASPNLVRFGFESPDKLASIHDLGACLTEAKELINRVDAMSVNERTILKVIRTANSVRNQIDESVERRKAESELRRSAATLAAAGLKGEELAKRLAILAQESLGLSV